MYGIDVLSGSRLTTSVSISSSQLTITALDAFAISTSCVVKPSITTLPIGSAFCAWMIDTSGFTAGTRTTGSPGCHGLSTTSRALGPSELFLLTMSVPSMLFDGMNGRPSEPARKRDAIARWL